MNLNPKQACFAKEWPRDHNATQAAIRAGYSKHTAYSQGQRLLNHVEVKAKISKIEAARDADSADEAVDKRTEALKDIDDGLAEAILKGNLSARKGFVELKLRSMGMLTDRLITEDAKAEAIKADERAELEELAQQRTIPIRGA